MGSVFNTRPAKNVQQYLKTLTVDPLKYRSEILSLHKKRTVHKISTKQNLSISYIRRAAAIDQSYRSRILSILMECKYIAGLVEPVKEDLLLRLMSNYYDQIPPTNKNEKRQYLELGFQKRFPILEQLYVAIETADFVIEDIDKASFMFKHIIQTYQVGTRSEINF